jgi:alkanesulfonate monooxygenase SsuD/methylene tetrahydromethanopterin reductase-like flavin-dependent oxidoreductase (luciferase family)
MNESIPLLREFWKGEPVSHSGRFFQIDDVHIDPPPAQPGGPPIIVAGRQEAAMRRAVTMGDGWMPYMYSPRRYAASVEVIRNAAAEAGRDLSGFGWYVWLFTNVNADGEAAREGAAGFMGGRYNQDFMQMVDSVAAAGSVEAVTEKFKAFVDAGVRHFIVMPATREGNRDSIVRGVLDEVMPAVREHAAGLT